MSKFIQLNSKIFNCLKIESSNNISNNTIKYLVNKARSVNPLIFIFSNINLINQS